MDGDGHQQSETAEEWRLNRRSTRTMGHQGHLSHLSAIVLGSTTRECDPSKLVECAIGVGARVGGYSEG